LLDSCIWPGAKAELEKGELAVALAAAHAGILPLVDFRYVDQAPACIRAIAAHEAELARGAIVTTERGRTRVRPADTQ
jgi:hypothetical protein